MMINSCVNGCLINFVIFGTGLTASKVLAEILYDLDQPPVTNYGFSFLFQDHQSEVVFWEPLSGARYSHEPVNEETGGLSREPKHGLKTIGCLFNHRHFFANSHPTDRVASCRFVLRDEARWKAMSEDAILAVTEQAVSPCLPSLAACTFDAVALSDDLETQLRASIVEQRRERGLTCTWDDQLSYLLSQALCAYESERTSGIATGNEEFQVAIRRHVPDGHTFKVS